MQVQDGLPGQLPMYKGTVDAARTIIRNEGWQGLYAGLTPSLIGSTVAWGTYLYLYEKIKNWYKEQQGIGSSSNGKQSEAGRLGAGYNLLSAAQAGAIVCVMTNPIWLVKTRLALQQRTSLAAAAGAAGSSGVAYRGLLDAFARIGREEGIKGYYKGFGPSLVLQTAHGAIQFAAYEELKHLASRAGQPAGSPDRSLTSAEVSVYGAASKFLAAVSTYPTQVVRSRLQQRSEGRSLVYNSSWQAVLVTWQREGLAGFYKGLLPSLMRVMPQSAITLMVYEGVVKLLDQQGEDEGQQQQQRGQGAASQQTLQRQGGKQQQQQRRPAITDGMSPLVIVADTQAEQ
jgi:solute carrier family 25 folate transporter 32